MSGRRKPRYTVGHANVIFFRLGWNCGEFNLSYLLWGFCWSCLMVEDYTNAFLVSAFVLVFMGLFTIWVFFGLVMAGLIGWTADRLIMVDFRNDGNN